VATLVVVVVVVVVVFIVVIVVPSVIPNMDKDTIPDHINPQYTHVPLPVLQMCQELSKILMIDAFGKRLFSWQKVIIAHRNLMTCPASGIPPWPTFLCAPPTGGGKSIARRDSFAAVKGNFSLCILPCSLLELIKLSRLIRIWPR
jgi:hypothetical protein